MSVSARLHLRIVVGGTWHGCAICLCSSNHVHALLTGQQKNVLGRGGGVGGWVGPKIYFCTFPFWILLIFGRELGTEPEPGTGKCHGSHSCEVSDKFSSLA